MRFYIRGMDCSSCGGKIETALTRLDGVSGVEVNLASEILELQLSDGAMTKRADIEALVRSLGFEIEAIDEQESGSAYQPPVAWWQSGKGRQVIGLGVLMGVAWLLAGLLPDWAHRVFVLAVILGVVPFARKALALARSGSPFSIEVLVSVAALGALFIGESAEAAAVVFLFAVGELLEGLAASRARSGIRALAALVPKTALLLDEQGGHREVAAASLKIGDVLLVRPGDRVAADAVIIQGVSSLNEAAISGESLPRVKSSGEKVFAGSINGESALQVRVEKMPADNSIARIIHLIEQAQASKAPTARFIETFSRYYTPVVMLLAALVVLLPPLWAGADWQTWLYRGLALLLIACPCALVLSTPAAIASALAAGARLGLLVKGGKALETLGRVSIVAFDKTGTLTEGRPQLTDLLACVAGQEDRVLMLAASLESASSHPLGEAIVQHAKDKGLAILPVTDAGVLPGKAIFATVDGRRLAVASPLYAAQQVCMTEQQQSAILTLQQQGKTVSVLLDEQQHEMFGVLAFRDLPRADSRAAVAQLKVMGVKSVMLTGDNPVTAGAIAGELAMDYAAALLPQDKLECIRQMQQNTKVAMVGDGINDAPALALADVGIAMGTGTDVALETADVALMHSRPSDVSRLLALARATQANIRQNVAFALGLKALFLLTTLTGVTGLWLAVLADTGATALVTLNALRLLRFGGKVQS